MFKYKSKIKFMVEIKDIQVAIDERKSLFYPGAEISRETYDYLVKVSTSFRLNAELVEKMKVAAKASNRSLNNFVESILLNVMFHDIAESTTMAAIEEAKEQQKTYSEGTLDMNPIDLSSVENMLKSMEGIKQIIPTT